MFIYKHKDTTDYVKKYPSFKKKQTSRVNN